MPVGVGMGMGMGACHCEVAICRMVILPFASGDGRLEAAGSVWKICIVCVSVYHV